MQFNTLDALFASIGLVVAAILYLRHQWRMQQEHNYWATRREPIIEYSRAPNDRYVEDRANYARAMLRYHGNPWADDLPVIAWPYAALRPNDPRFVSYEVYLSEVDEIRRTAKSQWFLKINNANPEAFKQFILHQSAR